MMRTAYLAGFAVLIALGTSPLCGAATVSVSGMVRDSAGVPQMGAEVELLAADLSVVASVYTNDKGKFSIDSVVPGNYAIKAMGAYFLPSLRENLRIRKATVVNLTLNTLYEAMQWLPAKPRTGHSQSDDWAWTLKSAANRPLLRWLEDGPLVVVSEGAGNSPKLKARLMATGQAGTFGESGERFSNTVELTPANSRELLARVDFAPDTDAGMESMLGFRQELGFAGSVQSVAAIAIHPDEFDGMGDEGVDEAAINSSETMHLGDEFELEAGSAEVAGHIAGDRPAGVTATLPYASLEWRDGSSAIQYRMATLVPNPETNDQTEAQAWLPAAAMRNGELVLERGMHQEIGFERQTDTSGVAVTVYADNIENPILEAMSRTAGGNPSVVDAPSAALIDPESSMIQAAGPGFSAAGVSASYEREIAGGNRIAVSYSSGSALVMPALPNPAGIQQMVAGTRAHRSQAYTLSFSGTLDGTHTRWRASYRWQPEDTVTAVAPFAVNASDPYLNLHLRQPIHLCRDGSGGIEALLDVRNLLAQGYRPYVLSDGSLLIFTQGQRAIRGGLAFTF
ncbi:MAG TPA: carboxypeptidase-like regulatory domain-containing protein [Terracidiphilus sp.]|nr:carboxypeptidase-like regulatory domain-containing protein [Terracidiphilus sp.]